MANRGVWQLKELVVRYCEHSGSSKGAREYISEGLIEFARKNPQLQIRTEIKPGRHPVIIANYCTNEQKVADLRNKDVSFISMMAQRMRDTSGRKMTRLKVPVKSQTPSVQGYWTETLQYPQKFAVNHRY